MHTPFPLSLSIGGKPPTPPRMLTEPPYILGRGGPRGIPPYLGGPRGAQPSFFLHSLYYALPFLLSQLSFYFAHLSGY